MRAVTYTKGKLGYSDTRGSETPRPIEMKFCTIDYVGADLAHTQNLVGGPKGVSSGRRGEVDTFSAFLFLVPRALLQLTLKGVAQHPMHQYTCFGGGYWVYSF